jgi:hypothetical protein
MPALHSRNRAFSYADCCHHVFLSFPVKQTGGTGPGRRRRARSCGAPPPSHPTPPERREAGKRGRGWVEGRGEGEGPTRRPTRGVLRRGGYGRGGGGGDWGKRRKRRKRRRALA